MTGREDSHDDEATFAHPEQVIPKFAEDDELFGLGNGLQEVCRHLEITESSWNR